jgi:hypothetical protein
MHIRPPSFIVRHSIKDCTTVPTDISPCILPHRKTRVQAREVHQCCERAQMIQQLNRSKYWNCHLKSNIRRHHQIQCKIHLAFRLMCLALLLNLTLRVRIFPADRQLTTEQGQEYQGRNNEVPNSQEAEEDVVSSLQSRFQSFPWKSPQL